MLPEIVSFDRQVTLVGDSGIQFMDFWFVSRTFARR
ncbi:Uncharacterised protein [Klebsiella pneumoniae]|uniref:Uncharacterized protein n=1 Tax=Klebsiella pneumoniae TaxID=573 RepID=A0A2X3H157_KLEPN|nr:Uncharacterised protein [Klebsiella pneumoniae]